MVSSKRHRVDRAAIAQDDLLLAAVEIQAGPLGDRLRVAAGRAGTGGLRPSRRVLRCSKRPRASSGLRSAARGVGFEQVRGSSRGSCCRSSRRGPLGSTRSSERLLRAEADAARPADHGVQPEFLDGAAGGRLDLPGPHGDAATGRADQDLQSLGIERGLPGGRGRFEVGEIAQCGRLMRIAPGFPEPGRGSRGRSSGRRSSSPATRRTGPGSGPSAA